MSDFPKDLLVELLNRFLFLEEPTFFAQFEVWNKRSSPIAPIVQAFRSNLWSAITVGSIPFTLVNSAVHERRFSHIHIAEQIRGLMDVEPGAHLSERQLQEAHSRAHAKMTQQLQTEEFRDSAKDEVLASLYQTKNDADLSAALDELRRQVTVMIWGTLEVVATDIATSLSNLEPELALKILSTETFRKWGVPKGVPIETLQEFSFDVTRSMGHIVFASRHLDTVPAICDVYEALFGDEKLTTALKSKSIWRLAQRRHLIVHKRGIVDQQYLSKTPDDQPVGSHLRVTSKDLDTYLVEVRDIGLRMAECTNQRLG